MFEWQRKSGVLVFAALKWMYDLNCWVVVGNESQVQQYLDLAG